MHLRPFFPVLVVGLLLLAPPVQAQYMFLDSNGDGVHTAADKLHPSGATTVDIWLDIAHNRDGSATSCGSDPTFPLEWFSYVVNLKATNGTVSYSGYTNRVSGLGGGVGNAANETELSTGLISTSFFSRLSPGKYLLGTLTVTVLTGSPSIQIVPTVAASTIGPTSFGSGCPGADGDNTIKLGTDWSDVDGLARPGQRKGGFAPNSLIASGKISFATEREGAASIRVFDAQGRLVRTLMDTRTLSVGTHTVTFDGSDDRGGRVTAGIYYYRVVSAAGTFGGRILVLQ